MVQHFYPTLIKPVYLMLVRQVALMAGLVVTAEITRHE